jgi:hypothetical protein
MIGSNSRLNPRAPGEWITNPSRTIRPQIIFYHDPKNLDSRLKNKEKYGIDKRTVRVNKFKRAYFFKNK